MDRGKDGRTSLIGRIGIALAIVIASITGLGPVSTSPAVAALECTGGWVQMRIPGSAFLAAPFEIVVRGNKAAAIVGGASKGALVLRRNGTGWKQVPGGRGHRGFTDAEFIGGGRLLGVGFYRPFTGANEGTLEPASGMIGSSSTQLQALPFSAGPRATLTAVSSSAGKTWAVGTGLSADGQLHAYALRRDGKRWRHQDPPAGRGSGVTDVERAPGGRLWVVGWKGGDKGRPIPAIYKRVGGGWKAVAAAPLPSGPAVLTDLTFRSATDGYASGYVVPTKTDEPQVVLQHWDGKRWSNVPLPWAEGFGALARSVAAGADGHLIVAGTQTATATRETRGFVAQRIDGVWSISLLDATDRLRSEVMAVAATRDGAVAAAAVGGTLLVLRSCDDGTPITPASKKTPRRKVEVSDIRRRLAAAPQEQMDALDALVIVPSAVPTRKLPAPRDDAGFKVRDMAAASGLREWTRSYDGFAADFDGDGYKDVFYSRHGGLMPRLALNGPDGFHDVPADSAFSSVDRHGCDVGDVDGDGTRDILCAIGGSRGIAVRRNELSLSPAEDSRTLARDGLGISDPLGRGRHVAIFRLDDDRFPEVFITNAPDREDGLPAQNRFYRNVGGRFVPAPGVGLDTSHGGHCLEATDIDADGDTDLVMCTHYGVNGRAPGLRIMRNENGRLRDRTVALGVRPMGDIDVAFADVTGDGRRDLIQLTSQKVVVSKGTRSGFRKIYQARVDGAWALAAGDANGDGKDDLYIARGSRNNNQPDRLLVSRNGGRSFASVRMPQTKKGQADDVFSLDYDKNGLADFVVLNGRIGSGPVQLLASFRR